MNLPTCSLAWLTQTSRRLFSLRDQLKVQFRATQKAQINERKASDSKRRLTSYMFHEVRVPLNTACEFFVFAFALFSRLFFASWSRVDFMGSLFNYLI